MQSKIPFALLLFAGSLAAVWAVDVHEGFTTSDGQYRTYFLHTPPGYDGKTPLPLVTNLHFGSGTGEQQALVSGMNFTADQQGFIVVYPDALGLGWQNHDTLFLVELLDTLFSRYAIDTQRVYMTGFSSGALMTHWMACKMSDKLGAVAPVAGTMLTYDWAGCYPERRISIISFNARNDLLVPYDGDGGYYTAVEKAMSNWAERLGCDNGPDTFYNETGSLRQTWARSDGACEVVLWTTEEGGHDWPTDSSPHQLSTNDVMWEFFLAHPLHAPEPAVEEMPAPPAFRLDPVNPGIFSQTATLHFTLASSEKVRLEVFDILGRSLVTVADEVLEPGEHTALLDLTGIKSGVYFWMLATAGSTERKSFLVIK